MESEIQKIIIGAIITILLPHAFLIFLESIKVSRSQFDDLISLEIQNLQSKMKFHELLRCVQKETENLDITTLTVIKSYIWLKVLRVIGFIPIALYFFVAILALSKDILIEDLSYPHLNQILVGLIFVFEVLFVGLKMGFKIPNVLMNLIPDYNDKNYLIVLFSIYPLWKKG